MTISADEAMRLAGDALVEAAHVSDEWGIDKAGFGASPAEAMAAFDSAWAAFLPPKVTP